jgi:hypothetical protein
MAPILCETAHPVEAAAVTFEVDVCAAPGA